MSSKAAQLGVAAGIAIATYYLYQTFIAPKEEKKEEGKSSVLNLPVIDFNIFLKKDEDRGAYEAECRRASEALTKYGVCVVRDPRVDQSDNNTFIDMMEKYFALSDWIRDARPEWHYQV